MMGGYVTWVPTCPLCISDANTVFEGEAVDVGLLSGPQ